MNKTCTYIGMYMGRSVHSLLNICLNWCVGETLAAGGVAVALTLTCRTPVCVLNIPSTNQPEPCHKSSPV